MKPKPNQKEKLIKECIYLILGFPSGSDDKESACNTGDLGSISG